MANESLFMSAEGLATLKESEAVIDGVYDDPSGYATYGTGHLVHPSDKWGSFVLEAASADATWKANVQKKWPGKSYETAYVQRSSKFAKDYDKLEEKAVGLAKERIAKKKYTKEFSKLSTAEQASVETLAKAAVATESALMAKTTDDVLKDDLVSYEQAVRSKITTNLTQSQFDALVSFSFNVGVSNFNGSDLAKKINENKYNSGSEKDRRAAIAAIQTAFASWNKSGGVVLAGLTKRRAAEASAFLAEPNADLEKLSKTPAPRPASELIPPRRSVPDNSPCFRPL